MKNWSYGSFSFFFAGKTTPFMEVIALDSLLKLLGMIAIALAILAGLVIIGIFIILVICLI